MPIRKAGELDAIVGSVIRQRRRGGGVSQQKLAAAIGLQHHQIQRYELGHDKVYIGRFIDIADALGVPPTDLMYDVMIARTEPRG